MCINWHGGTWPYCGHFQTPNYNTMHDYGHCIVLEMVSSVCDCQFHIAKLRCKVQEGVAQTQGFNPNPHGNFEV